MAKRSSVIDPADGKKRCGWAATDPILAAYHDKEWGKAIPTDAGHLQRIASEIFQCGLSWKIVLVKMPAMKLHFHDFEIEKVARMTAKNVTKLCENPAMIRNARKIEATIHNAKVMRDLAAENGSYVKWLKSLPAKSPDEVAALYKLFKKTFKFMGPETTKCYFMGCGKIPPDHEPKCWMA
ncbi:MAG: DNA-3-methyladenine glycosylase I [Planctomycetes bacterium]|nr:DNA-3-methyladenine glycosylase I [Planctomycetota bacterium]